MGYVLQISDNGFLFIPVMCCWFCIRRKGLKKDNDNGAKMYEEYVKQRKTFSCKIVTVEGNEASEVANNILDNSK